MYSTTTTATGVQAATMTSIQTDGLIDQSTMRIFQWICFMSCEAIVVFGTGTNIVNIVCFVKQGFKDPINISLLSLAISDIGSLVTVVWTSLSVIPAYQDADLPFITIEVQYLISGMPHVAFTRISSWITALITLERCLCITMPLKVKDIITPKRATIIIVIVFIVLIASVTPVYYANRLGLKFSPEHNKTLLGLVYTQDRVLVEQISYAINNVAIPFSAFVIITMSMIVLVVKLRKQAIWRLKCAAIASSDNASERDQRVARMVVMISTLFMACFIPSGVVFLAMVMEPELNMDGKYKNMLIVAYGIGMLLESMNSSMNIFIYYRMSSKYRTCFRKMFKFRDLKVRSRPV